MLEKALFRKHTKLFLYMAERKYFSQKELINYCLKNEEFKDKDSIENKGQFRDKMIKYGILKKYTFKEFASLFSDKIMEASIAYTEQMERKRCILEFDSNCFLSLDYKSIKELNLPFREYVIEIQKINQKFFISDIVKAFIFGCSIHRILLFNEKFSHEMRLLSLAREEVNEELLPLVEIARIVMETNIKESLKK